MEFFATILKCHFNCCGSSEQEENSEVDPKDNRRWQISSSDVSTIGGPSKWKKLSSWLQSLQPRHTTDSSYETGNETPLTIVPTEASSEYLTNHDLNGTEQCAPMLFRAFHADNYEWLERYENQNPKLKHDVFLTILHNRKHLLLPKYYSKSTYIINGNSSLLSLDKHTRFLRRRFSDSHLLCNSSSKLNFIDLSVNETNLSEFKDLKKRHRPNLKYAEKSYVDTSAHLEIKQKICNKLFSFWNTALLPKKSVCIDSNFIVKESVDVKSGCARISDQLAACHQTPNVESHINFNNIIQSKSKKNIGSRQIEYLVQADTVLTEPIESSTICKIDDGSDIIFPIKKTVDYEELDINSEQDNDLKLSTPTSSIAGCKSKISSRGNDSVIAAWKQVQQTIGNLKSKLKEKCLSETASDNIASSSELLKKCNTKHKKQNLNIENDYSFTPSKNYAAQSVKACTVMNLELQSHCKEKMSRKTSDHFPEYNVGEPSCKHRSVLVNDGFEENNVPIRPKRGKRVAKYGYSDEQNNFLTQKENYDSSHEGSIDASRRAFTYNMIYDDITDKVITCTSTGKVEPVTELFDSYNIAHGDPEFRNESEDPKNIPEENTYLSNPLSSKNVVKKVSTQSDISFRDSVESNECERIPNEYSYIFNKPNIETAEMQFSYRPLRDNDISMEDVFEPKCDNINIKDMVTSRKITDNDKRLEKKSVDITVESNEDMIIFTSKLDIEIIKNVSSSTEHLTCENIISSTPIDKCAINCDIKNESDVIIDKEINYNSKILCSSRVATQSPESSYSLNVAKLQNQTISEEESDPLCSIGMFYEVNHDTRPHIFVKEDSQPHIFITPADGSTVNKCCDVLTSNSFEDSNLSQNDNHVYSSSFVNVHCSVESHIDCSSVLSEIDGLFPNDGYVASTCLTPTTIKSRPTTPKSPITVQEWVDSLPNNPSTAEQRYIDHDEDANDWRDDMLNFISDEQFHLLHKRRQTRESIADETLFLGDEAAALAPILPSKDDQQEECEHSLLSLDEQKKPPPPLTLHDIRNVMSKSESGVVKSWHGEAICRRSQFADARDMQASFQSEASNLSFFSHQTAASSIESLLESRQADPVDILLNLGFGGGDEDDGLSRIPARFLKPSQVPGNDINMFLKQEDNISDLVDSSDWVVPGISAQALRKSSFAVVSPLVANLLESLRRCHGASSDIPKRAQKRFATVARGLGKQALFARAFSRKLPKKFVFNEDGRVSVLMPENRLHLDRQDRESSESPKKKIILGRESFSIGCNDEIIYSDNESALEINNKDLLPNVLADVKRKHRDSIVSVISSTTSIDSKEEELREELQQLRISLIRKPQPPLVPPFIPPLIPSYEFGRTNHRTIGQSSTAKKKSLMQRLSAGSKRKAFASQSSNSSWEMESQIAEEDAAAPNSLYTQVITENLASDQFKRSDFSSDLESNVFESGQSGSASETSKCAFQFPHPNSRELNISYFKAITSTSKDSSPNSSDEGSEDKSLGVSSCKKKRKSFIDCFSKDSHVQQQSGSEFPKSSVMEAAAFALNDVKQNVDKSNAIFGRTKKLSQLKNSNGNWSMESGKSIETVKHFPLSRSLALFPSPVCSGSKIASVPSEYHEENSEQSNEVDSDLRRTNSMPTILVDNENDSSTNKDQILNKESREGSPYGDMDANMKDTFCNLQRNFNTALLAVFQTCKMQSNLQEMLSRDSSTRTLNSHSRVNHNIKSDVYEDTESTQSKTLRSEKPLESIGCADGKVNNGNPEALEIATRMKASVSAVVSHLEHYLANVCPTESHPDISNTIGQMLWLTHQQNQLCSDLERMSSPDLSMSGIQSPNLSLPSTTAWASSHPNFHRSMPEHLNTHYLGGAGFASPMSAHSASPFFGIPFPSFVHHSTPTLNAQDTPLSNIARPSSRRLQHSLSESSCEESCEFGENSVASEWNEGKQSNISSPAYNSHWPQAPSEAVIGDIVREKISREIEENFGLKVNQMSSAMGNLHEKLDQNFEDVAEIRKKLDTLIEYFSDGKK